MAKKIDQHILAILSRMQADGALLKLTCGQLDRKDYMRVDEVLQAMGGKWDRRRGGHVFAEDPTEKLEQVLMTGEFYRPQDFGFFPTPQDLAERVAGLLRLEPGDLVLEPEAGHGRLADAAARVVGQRNVHCVELLEENARILGAKGYEAICGDFLAMEPKPIYNKILMNPPFSRQADIDHVRHAFGFLKPGGRLVGIMCANVLFRENRKTLEFREFLQEHGSFETNPEGSFKASGTAVGTITVLLGKPLDRPCSAAQQGLFPWYRTPVPIQGQAA